MKPPTEMLEAVLAALRAGETRGLFAAVFFLLGFALLGSLIHQLRIRRWPTVPGTLLAGGLERFGARPLVLSDEQHVARVSYRYRVGDAEYEGHRLSPWVVVASRDLRWLLERQLAGAVGPDGGVSVHHDPRRPERSYLKRPGLLGLAVTAALMLFAFHTPWLLF